MDTVEYEILKFLYLNQPKVLGEISFARDSLFMKETKLFDVPKQKWLLAFDSLKDAEFIKVVGTPPPNSEFMAAYRITDFGKKKYRKEKFKMEHQWISKTENIKWLIVILLTITGLIIAGITLYIKIKEP